MVDQEPHRSVQLIRRIDTRIPTPLLSQHVASSTASLGRLADLRAPAGRAGAGVSVAVGGGVSGIGGMGLSAGAAGVGGSRWTAVVGKSAPTMPGLTTGHASSWGGASPARVPSPSKALGGGPSRSPAPGVSSTAGASTDLAGITGKGAGGASSAGAWVSPSVQAQRAREAAAAVMQEQKAGEVEMEDVPDNWEDDT